MFTTGLEQLLAKIASLQVGVEGPKAWQGLQERRISSTGIEARNFLESLGKKPVPKPAQMPAGSGAFKLPTGPRG